MPPAPGGRCRCAAGRWRYRG
ncbi:hypothetical protein ACFW62_10970 [Streptomyces olivaceus]